MLNLIKEFRKILILFNDEYMFGDGGFLLKGEIIDQYSFSFGRTF